MKNLKDTKLADLILMLQKEEDVERKQLIKDEINRREIKPSGFVEFEGQR